MGNRHARIATSSVLCLMAMLSGCDETKSRTTAEPAGVEASYQELAAEFAACGEQIEQCLGEADADRAARFRCKVEFGQCRAEAGKQALQRLRESIHACVERARQCRDGEDAGPHECRSELWACLWHTRHPGGGDSDADAGSDEGGAQGRDCIDNLRRAAWAGKDADSCARGVRECVADALPEPEDVVEDDDAPGAQPSHDPAHGKPPVARGGAGRPTCLPDFRTCVRQTRDTRACVEALRQCAHPR